MCCVVGGLASGGERLPGNCNERVWLPKLDKGGDVRGSAGHLEREQDGLGCSRWILHKAGAPAPAISIFERPNRSRRPRMKCQSADSFIPLPIDSRTAPLQTRLFLLNNLRNTSATTYKCVSCVRCVQCTKRIEDPDAYFTRCVVNLQT